MSIEDCVETMVKSITLNGFERRFIDDGFVLQAQFERLSRIAIMLKAKFPTAHHVTVSIFGCQYHASSPSRDKLALISHFDSLVKPSARCVDQLEHDDPPTHIWVTYWDSPQTFKAWWESAPVLSFWEALPRGNAGFWRETISLPATRAMYMSSKPWANGFGSVAELVPLTSRSGYWGAYRSRFTPDGPEDKFTSPLEDIPTPKPLGEICPGRVTMTSFPDNVCFLVEGQDLTAMGEREKAYWDEHLSEMADEWISTVLAGTSQGLLTGRGCHGSGNEQRHAQLLFFHDMSRIEQMAKNDKTHVKLRKDLMYAAMPGGAMHGGNLMLWVDMGILKGEEMDAEYIGCYDGTGFLAYDNQAAFSSRGVECEERLGLPTFFDEPVPSFPEEW